MKSTRTQTEAMWLERVRAWREEGVTAEAFAQGKSFAASTLRYWSSRLNRTSTPKFFRVVARTTAAKRVEAELYVEIAGARVRVVRGFDAVLFADVVRALRDADR